jgi:transposase
MKAGMPQKSGTIWRNGFRRVRVWEVIPVNKSKLYRSVPVKQVDPEKAVFGHRDQCVEAGLDFGKHWIFVAFRFRNETYARPWRARNPLEVRLLVELLKRIGERVKLKVAMESTGTYADSFRQAMHDAGMAVYRVSSKASHDWAESFDGVPSQHDGKDAGVVAELCALGKSVLWPLRQKSQAEQEMAYWVDQLDAAHRMHQLWMGRLESRLARHWPEACAVLKLSRPTLLKALRHWSGPDALACDPQASVRLKGFSGRLLSEGKIQELIGSAKQSVGMRMTDWDRRRMRDDAGRALRAHRQKRAAQRRLAELASGHELLPTLGRVVGTPTACVLWTCLGDPRDYTSGAAYRKAMGLNLAERSSGTYKGQLRITKRGKSLPRRFLYFAALRYIISGPVRDWYLRKKKRDREEGMRGIVAVMRKLPLALHAVAQGQAFDAALLFNSIVNDRINRPLKKEVIAPLDRQ